METSFATKSARVLIAEGKGVSGKSLSETLRTMGFLEVAVVGTSFDVFYALEYGDCDWIIMPTCLDQAITAFHILKTICETPSLRRIRVSLLVDTADEKYLLPAFYFGLLSWHSKVGIQSDPIGEIDKHLELMKIHNWTTALIAAEYFRRYMYSIQSYEPLLKVERAILGLFPGSLPVLMKLGETQLRAGRLTEGLGTLHQACVIDERARKITEVIIANHAASRVNVGYEAAHSIENNVLGIKICVIIDPDVEVLSALKELMTLSGVEQIETFSDGVKAWAWLSTHPEPDLILQEWRIPSISGAFLLQRIRHHGFSNVPINVLSSVIKPEESHLLREFGVANVIAKPFDSQGLFKSLVWTMQQHVFPTEQNSLQQKLKRLLHAEQMREAEQLKNNFIADPRIKTSCKKTVEANFAYGAGEFRQARDLATEALKLQGDALCLLNLIGKCLILLGDPQAAVKTFERAHSMSPMNIENLCLLAIAQSDNGEKGQAEATLQKARVLDEDSQMINETDCQIAIVHGDTAKAKFLMATISNWRTVVLSMMERAQGLTRSGRFEAGLQVFRNLNDSIPQPLNMAKDEISYHLGRAFANCGELQEAKDLITALLNNRDSILYEKALRLLKGIEKAIRLNSRIPFYANPLDNEEIEKGMEKIEDEDDNPPSAPQGGHSGEMCLNGILILPSDERTQWSALFDRLPAFLDRSGKRALFVRKGL